MVVVVLITGCGDDEDALAITGAWTGTTEQGLPVSFRVDALNDKPWITEFSIAISTDSSIENRDLSDPNGLIQVFNNAFTINMGSGVIVTGSFVDVMNASGDYDFLVINSAREIGTWQATK